MQAVPIDGIVGDRLEKTSLDVRLRLLDDWADVLRELAIDDRMARLIAERALANRTCFHAELLASGRVREDLLCAAVAKALGLRFLANVPADRLVIDESQAITVLRGMRRNATVTLRGRRGAALFVVAPFHLDLGSLRARLRGAPALARRLVLATPGALRAALMVRAGPALSREASLGLFGRTPDLSARFVTNPWQAFATGLILAGVPMLLYAAPKTTVLALSGVLTLLFLGCVGLRLLAGAQRSPFAAAADIPDDGSPLPVYSILIALHREADVVPDLLAALGRIDWPRSRLEVKLVCEADDTGTLSALERHALRSWVEIVRVPPGQPRTKPKALNFALPTCTGDLVALYDAEDRPHPQQLRAAWNALRAGGEDLACVQAPLQIANAAFGVLPFLFRIEYAAHFRGLLPWLAERDLLMPLGGTSNHFRRAVLEEVGGWDPHNVTEDADLGVRLARFGYRVGVISPPTLEDAPETLPIWFRQRTRWFKGFLHTWLVHMRMPGRLCRELGPGSFAIFHLLIGGVVVSALLHPLLLVTTVGLAFRLVVEGALPQHEAIVLGLATMNVIGGYGAQLLLSWSSLDQSERAGFWKAALLTPAYWMMLSVVGYRAVFELARNPHHWAKTPHRRYRREAAPGGQGFAGASLLARLRRHLPTMSGPEQTILPSSSPITESSRPA
ncbi:glycosyltransferase [Aquibium microcysteis]|uniref:glycosyltransferase n=1 Tax=Aquibium microcysteis TaxID=675281 RepID=UPI00165D28CF|nr:glycosyltransferase [Aquibium microcysteis]